MTKDAMNDTPRDGQPVTAEDEGVYSLENIREMLGLSRGVVLAFVHAGFVAPTRGPRNAYRFGFRDVVLLRTATTLRAADISARRIRRSLTRLRTLLPQSMPLTGLRITAIGDDIAVREAGQDVALETGQILLDFDIAPGAGTVLSFPDHRAVEGDDAATSIERAARLETTDRAGAKMAYRTAIGLDPDLDAAWLGLGALLHEDGTFADALALYDDALTRLAVSPELHFNRAIVLEDLGRPDDALAAYERCLALDPDFADAHWNAGRLYEERGVGTQAVQHYSAYRRLQKR